MPLKNTFAFRGAETEGSDDTTGPLPEAPRPATLMEGFIRAPYLCAPPEGEEMEMLGKNAETRAQSEVKHVGAEEPPVQHLAIIRRKAAFSNEELAFFREAINQSHANQTHFSDPRGICLL